MKETAPIRRIELTRIRLEEVDSTNTYAKQHFDDLPDGALVRADFQTAGRGRLSRVWVSPRGKNLTCTFVMKQVREPFHATAAAGLAALLTVRQALPDESVLLKWPNDVYCRGRKIAGILCEAIVRNGEVAGVVAGIGLNVNATEEDFSGFEREAVSMNLLGSAKKNIEKIASLLEFSLLECYILYSKFPAVLFETWKQNNLIGVPLSFTDVSGGSFPGVVRDICPDGTLEVRTRDGQTVLFSCGDIRIDRHSLSDPSNFV